MRAWRLFYMLLGCRAKLSKGDYKRVYLILDAISHRTNTRSSFGICAVQLQWTNNYNGQTITMDKQLQWENHYNGQTITMGKQFQWTYNYNGQTITMGKQLQWANNYNGQTITMDKQLHWANDYNEQTFTMDKQLQWANNYNGQTITMGKQLQWAHTYKYSTDVIYIWYILLLLHLQIKYVIYNAGFKSARRVFWHGELSQKKTS